MKPFLLLGVAAAGVYFLTQNSGSKKSSPTPTPTPKVPPGVPPSPTPPQIPPTPKMGAGEYVYRDVKFTITSFRVPGIAPGWSYKIVWGENGVIDTPMDRYATAEEAIDAAHTKIDQRLKQGFVQ